jgi:hypothetical protein
MPDVSARALFLQLNAYTMPTHNRRRDRARIRAGLILFGRTQPERFRLNSSAGIDRLLGHVRVMAQTPTEFGTTYWEDFFATFRERYERRQEQARDLQGLPPPLLIDNASVLGQLPALAQAAHDESSSRDATAGGSSRSDIPSDPSRDTDHETDDSMNGDYPPPIQ